MTTVREIAEFAGVSKSTVSLVLNNKPGVSAEMRQTVLDAVTELEALHAVDTNPTDDTDTLLMTSFGQGMSIMVLHPPVLRSSEVFSRVLQGIQSAAERSNMQLRLVVNDPHATEQHVAHLYLADDNLRPDGVLVFGAQHHEPLIEATAERNIPCVVLGREATQYAVSGIERDEDYHAYQLTRHLIDLGHRNIAFCGGDDNYDFTRNRLAGYRAALSDAGIVGADTWCVLGDGERATACVLDNNTHTQDERVTAIVYVNDSYAAEGLAVLHDRGLAIPDDISVVSFDDTSIASTHEPPITSIAYDHFREGQWAVKMLLDQMRNPFVSRIHYVFDAELIIRPSSAPPT